MQELSEFDKKPMQELNEIYAGIFRGLQYGLICTNKVLGISFIFVLFTYHCPLFYILLLTAYAQ